jgi:uncharacterized SAM-binding protein YcdF (DUF218 family)
VGVFLLWQKRFPKLGRRGGRACLAFSVCWLAVFGNVGVCNYLLLGLENEFPAVPEFSEGVFPAKDLSACKYVMVLGGGVNYHKDRSALGRLGRPTLARLMEGMRIARVVPEAKLIVSGAGPEEGLSAALEQERALASLGMERGRIARFDSTRDTREEIEALKKLAGVAPVALVTSASHLRRAMALCEEMGVRAVPCPCDYLVYPATQETGDFFKWGYGALGGSAVWFHEWLGKLFA